MGLLNLTKAQYYQGNNGENKYGDYQFISLHDIITQFEIGYVGENKIIPNIKRTDISFYAQRALQELSFDTFKSIKGQEIIIPPTLQMLLPQDYVNYTKLSWVDGAGIKHPLYPTRHTSNPVSIDQYADGDYIFGDEMSVGINLDFEQNLNIGWSVSPGGKSKNWDSVYQSATTGSWWVNNIYDTIDIHLGRLRFEIHPSSYGGDVESRAYAAWQMIDVSTISWLDLSAVGTSADQIIADGTHHTLGTVIADYGVIRIGITTQDPTVGWPDQYGVVQPATHSSMNPNNLTPNFNPNNFDKGYLEWNDGTSSQKTLNDINVEGYSTVWLMVQCYTPYANQAFTPYATGTLGGQVQITPAASNYNDGSTSYMDDIELIAPGQNPNFTPVNADGNSTAFNNYKSVTPSENSNFDYEDGVYWPLDGERYGLDPEHAEVNGSFYIDEIAGKIHFSSNVNGKTVILDYISDSMGTDEEMQVHKLAEEAMYKWIAHAIISTSSYGQQMVPRLAKEKFAAVRKAKLRLSNIKLEELTQILRGKSKWIKH